MRRRLMGMRQLLSTARPSLKTWSRVHESWSPLGQCSNFSHAIKRDQDSQACDQCDESMGEINLVIEVLVKLMEKSKDEKLGFNKHGLWLQSLHENNSRGSPSEQ